MARSAEIYQLSMSAIIIHIKNLLIGAHPIVVGRCSTAEVVSSRGGDELGPRPLVAG